MPDLIGESKLLTPDMITHVSNVKPASCQVSFSVCGTRYLRSDSDYNQSNFVIRDCFPISHVSKSCVT